MIGEISDEVIWIEIYRVLQKLNSNISIKLIEIGIEWMGYKTDIDCKFKSIKLNIYY